MAHVKTGSPSRKKLEERGASLIQMIVEKWGVDQSLTLKELLEKLGIQIK